MTVGQPERGLLGSEELLNYLQSLLPGIIFKPGQAFSWSPEHATVTYCHGVEQGSASAVWALLHEAGHALLNHISYHDDLDLLQKEGAAWDKAQELGLRHGIAIDEDHIQDCLDTYRDWLHKRSTCPRCATISLAISSKEYQCHNCHTKWQVSSSRLCRSYRLATTVSIKKSPEKSQATFH